MEVVVPMPRSPEYPFDNAAASPYTSPPPSPRAFGEPFYHFTSAPSSPTRSAAFYTRFTASECPTAPHLHITDASGGGGGGGYLFDFTFYPCLQAQCLPEIAAADELFEKGRIRPLQPAPPPVSAEVDKVLGHRERDLTSSANSNGNRSRELRSHSPVRNEELVLKKRSPFPTNPEADSAKGGRARRRWARLKDLLQFRSASEGRVTGRGRQDPLKKFTLLPSVPLLNKKGGGEDKRSQRCSEVGSMRSGAVAAETAHEMHCTAKRAAAEEQRKKTAPQRYQRHGLLLGLMPFNPAIRRS